MKTYADKHGLDKFIIDELPIIIDKLFGKPLVMIFASYRQIGLYPTGLVPINIPNLKVFVSNGGGKELNNLTMNLMAIKANLLDIANIDKSQMERLEIALRGKNQDTVNTDLESIANQQTSGTNQLLCIYCGPSGLQLAAKTAEKFRAQFPSSIIIGASCTCGLPGHEYEDPFDYFVQHNQCGMEQELADFMDIFIASWANKHNKT